ncbi:hypothetical protein AB1I63_05965 [Streptococcus pneumoniae]
MGIKELRYKILRFNNRKNKKRESQKTTTKKWTSEFFVDVETKNIKEFNELLDETRNAVAHLENCLNRLSNFKVEIELKCRQ